MRARALCVASAGLLALAACWPSWFRYGELEFGLLRIEIVHRVIAFEWNVEQVTLAREMHESLVRSVTYVVGGIATFAGCWTAAALLVATAMRAKLARWARRIVVATAVLAIAFCFAKPELEGDFFDPIQRTRYGLDVGLVLFALGVIGGCAGATMLLRYGRKRVPVPGA
jgi:hypothetical protein